AHLAHPPDPHDPPDDRDRRRPPRRVLEEVNLLADHEALAAQAFHVDRNDVAALDELLTEDVPSRQPRIALLVRLRGAEAAEDVARAARREQAVRAVARQHLVADLLGHPDLPLEDLGRQHPLAQILRPAAPLPAPPTHPPPPPL